MGGHFFLAANATFPPNNGGVQKIAQVMKAVLSSAAEAELGALFINEKQVPPMDEMLVELIHPKPPTVIQT